MAHVTTTRTTVRRPVSEILALPWENLHDLPGASTKVLWRSGTSLAGVLRLDPGMSLGAHAHARGEHHAYVLEGRCLVDGELLTEGGYVHVPAGVTHEVTGGHPDGCRVLYLFLGDD